VGVAVLGSVLAAVGSGSGHLFGFQLAFVVAAGLMIASAAVALLIKDGDAAATMARSERAATVEVVEPAGA
jgi:hypothetical protein